MLAMQLRLVLISTAASAMLFAQPPATPKRPATDTYHSVKVTDDYRWLENASDPSVQAWSDGQNRNARRYLDGLPTRTSVYEELNKLITRQSARYFAMTY